MGNAVKGEWVVYIDDDKTPHLVIKDGASLRAATLDESNRAATMLNEEGSNIIRLSCNTETCADRGGWIERTREDAKKTVYKCDVCGRPLTR